MYCQVEDIKNFKKSGLLPGGEREQCGYLAWDLTWSLTEARERLYLRPVLTEQRSRLVEILQNKEKIIVRKRRLNAFYHEHPDRLLCIIKSISALCKRGNFFLLLLR